MLSKFEGLLQDILKVTRLALPVVIAELGWMGMTTVDTIMVGPLGPAAIGALGVSSSAFYTIAIFGMGLLLGLDTLVSQAHGAGDSDDTHLSLSQGIYLAIVVSIPLTVIFLYLPAVFRIFGINPQVSYLAELFVRTLTWSTLPLLLYGAFRRYLQGMGQVRPVMFVLITANLVNWFCNWLLIQGRWGLPALGVTGSALSTCIARVYMAAGLLLVIWYFDRNSNSRLLRPLNLKRMQELLKLGLPAATQIVLEIGAFGAAAMLAGRLEPEALAAHQIAITCASITYMVPLGIASASAVAVGQAIGRSDFALARRNGYIAIGLACAFMICSAIAFVAVPQAIFSLYSHDAKVVILGIKLLGIAALFQLFDGIQTVATGALRGLGETNIPMLVNLCGYWLFGLPVGYYFCFQMSLGVRGLWWGLTAALIIISVVLLLVWQRKSASALQYHERHALC